MDPVTRAACYIRVSTEEQTEYSPDAQQRALARYASQHGLTTSTLTRASPAAGRKPVRPSWP